MYHIMSIETLESMVPSSPKVTTAAVGGGKKKEKLGFGRDGEKRRKKKEKEREREKQLQLQQQQQQQQQVSERGYVVWLPLRVFERRAATG